MSMGYGGLCKKFVEDEEFVVYEYFAYNLNIHYSNLKEPDEKQFDGFITIRKNSLIEPDFRDKTRKMPNGRRKTLTKKIFKEVELLDLLNVGAVHIENCSNAWRILPIGFDFIACRLCRRIFFEYQQNGSLPEKISLNF
ncbi:MAG: hypothetical protein IJU91_05830 [Selenomonadaceae bacterium]|nr:hypothetical protein [Selenomonadaceae bacterium]